MVDEMVDEIDFDKLIISSSIKTGMRERNDALDFYSTIIEFSDYISRHHNKIVV